MWKEEINENVLCFQNFGNKEEVLGREMQFFKTVLVFCWDQQCVELIGRWEVEMFANQALKYIKFRHYILRNIALSSYLQQLSHKFNWRRSVMKQIYNV